MKFALTSFLILLFICNSFGQKKDASKNGYDDYVVMNNGDTLRGEVNFIGAGITGVIFKLKTLNGDKERINSKEAKSLSHDGILFEMMPENPQNTNSRKDFLMVMMRNKSFAIYGSIISTTGGVNGAGGSSGIALHSYYLFDKKKFIEEVTKKNYKDLIPKYFSDCSSMISILNEEDFNFKDKNIHRLIDSYYKECHNLFNW